MRLTWVKNLPRAIGKWGFDAYGWVNSHFTSRPNGSMDEVLFMLTVEFYASLYPNLSPNFVWDSDKLVSGPILIKSDNGPGQICKSLVFIEF